MRRNGGVKAKVIPSCFSQRVGKNNSKLVKENRNAKETKG
jgi:hypothetical protein